MLKMELNFFDFIWIMSLDLKSHPKHDHILISKTGYIYSLKTKVPRRYVLRKDGYYYIRTHKRHYHLVHILIAETFIPNPRCKDRVLHKNKVKTDNRVENLEWYNKKDNKRLLTELTKDKALNFGDKGYFRQQSMIKKLYDMGLLEDQISKITKLPISFITDWVKKLLY